MILDSLRKREIRSAARVVNADERRREDDRGGPGEDGARGLAVRQISRKMYGRNTSRLSSSFVTSRKRSVAAIDDSSELPSCGV